MAIGKAGAKNAAYSCCRNTGFEIMKISKRAYEDYRAELSRDKGEAGK
jgi:hypothetical protein